VLTTNSTLAILELDFTHHPSLITHHSSLITMKISLLLLFLLPLIALSCVGAPRSQDKEVASLDFVFEYQSIENDSITQMQGNNLRLHTGKAVPGQFYPMIITFRKESDKDQLLSTDVISSEESLAALLLQQYPNAKTFGLVIRESARKEVRFDEGEAIKPIRKLVKQIPGATLVLFHEKEGALLRQAGNFHD
jgi:hypothetical protein